MNIHSGIMKYVVIKVFMYCNYVAPVLNACTDRTPLGMANGLITSSQLSNSSIYSTGSSDFLLPSRGRLYSSGTWCSRERSYLSEWFQVSFYNQTIINGIATQGDPNYALNFIKEFRLEYSNNGKDWTRFHNDKKFTGNVDNTNVVYNWFTTSMVATHVRLYATRVHRTDVKAHTCLRIELYGCLKNETLLPLGMSSGIIKDSQLIGNNGQNAKAARLFVAGEGMILERSNMYLQIDLTKAKTVTGISIQGSYKTWNKRFVKKYTLSYSNDIESFTQLEQNFLENTDLGAVFVSISQPTTMKYVRITALTCENNCGMKVEIYGYDPVCFQTLADINTYRRDGSSVTNVDIDSPYGWCATDASDYVQIVFNKQVVISGIILQGDSNRDGWVKEYDVQYGVSTFKYIKNLIGTTARISPLSVNWLNEYAVTNFLHIIPKSCNNGRCCLRFRIKGCQLVLEEPHTIQGSISSSTITFTWKAPYSHPLPVDKYHLTVATSKDYQHESNFSFPTISSTTPHLSYNVPNVTFAAARVQINITAEILNEIKSAPPYNFYIQPKDPSPPGLVKTVFTNDTNNVTIVTLTSSSDENGPISYYEIVISTTRKTNLPWKLTNQAESELKNLDYFLAATVKADDLPTDGIKYTFVEGKEDIDGINARISTTGKYYLYSRAVINGNDITKYGFNNINYYSNLSQEILIDIKVSPKPIDPTASSSIGLITGVAAAGVAIIIVLVIVIIFMRRRRKTLKNSCNKRVSSTSIELKDHNDLKSHENVFEDDHAGLSNESYYNVAAEPAFPPLSIQEFLSFYLEHKDKTSSDIVKQFKSVPLEHLHEHKVGSIPKNKEKNRYLNVTAYDHTRVVLQKITGKETNDYINANYIQNYNGQVEYIAAQGPKKGTIFDFWRMVLGEKPAAIVMLTNVVEDEKAKCAQYWPIDNGKEVYNGIEVEVIEVQVYADYVIRKMRVGYEDNKHQLTHLHFTSWPDHGCPDYPTLLLNFCYRVRQLIPYESGKQLLVHCSAGVGRTGSYIIIDAMLHLVRTKKLVDIYNYFESIRQDRVQMVQRVEQYKFIYSAINEVLCCGYTGITSSEFQNTYKKLVSAKHALEVEFKRLNSVNIPFGEENYKAALLEKNSAKNRYPNILARDVFRVYVPQTKNSTDYINAVFVNGYKKKEGIIATQAPLVETLNDFWVVVMEHNVTTIVVLNSTDENYHNYPSLCPFEGSEKFGNLTVNVESNTRVGDISMQSILISNRTNDRKVNKFQLNWPNHDIPDCSSLLTLIDEVLKSQQFYGDGTILVTCSDGANRSGTFIACMNALDQLKVEQHIDVFQTVRRMRLARPEFVENMGQYQFIYAVLNKYLDSFATYSNFN